MGVQGAGMNAMKITWSHGYGASSYGKTLFQKRVTMYALASSPIKVTYLLFSRHLFVAQSIKTDPRIWTIQHIALHYGRSASLRAQLDTHRL